MNTKLFLLAHLIGKKPQFVYNQYIKFGEVYEFNYNKSKKV